MTQEQINALLKKKAGTTDVKEEKEMVEETKVTEEVMVAAYEEVVAEVKVEAPVEEPVEEAPVEEPVEEAPIEEPVEETPVAAPVAAPVTSDEEVSDNEESAEAAIMPVSPVSKLPVINPTDKKVVLCRRGKYEAVLMPIYNKENLVVEGCKLYLVDIETNIPMIGSGNELKIAKDKLEGATDHRVMKIMDKFTVTFSEDDKKLAFERAKIFLENVEEMVGVSNSMTIMDAYVEVVMYAIEKAAQEERAKVMDGDRKCKYDKEGGIVKIKDDHMKTVLDEIGSGFTVPIFCKKLSVLQEHLEKEIIIRNRGRRGYSYNHAGNIRYYTFRIIDGVFDNEGGVA